MSSQKLMTWQEFQKFASKQVPKWNKDKVSQEWKDYKDNSGFKEKERDNTEKKAPRLSTPRRTSKERKESPKKVEIKEAVPLPSDKVKKKAKPFENIHARTEALAKRFKEGNIEEFVHLEAPDTSHPYATVPILMG